MISKVEKFKGCIIGGAIGDAWGSGYENQTEEDVDTFYINDRPDSKSPKWKITDDTQLTLATINSILLEEDLKPESVASEFLSLYRQKKLRGIGSTTLKALQELNVGGHWSQVGRKGEYAAGNGAAMRVAPLAFIPELSNTQLRDICRITHRNDEAYIGGLSVVIAIREVITNNWTGQSNLIEMIIDKIPDTRVRDRLIEIKDIKDLSEVGKKGNDGYVVNSIPLAIAAANQVKSLGMEDMFSKLIEIGGDTDTNCSIAGQIAGSLLGIDMIPKNLVDKLSRIPEYQRINMVIDKFLVNRF